MTTVRKFFNAKGKEVEAEEADSCHEIVVDKQGIVISEGWYFAEEQITPSKTELRV